MYLETCRGIYYSNGYDLGEEMTAKGEKFKSLKNNIKKGKRKGRN